MQQAIDNRQQTTGNRQQATGNTQQATGNRQQAIGNRQLLTHFFTCFDLREQSHQDFPERWALVSGGELIFFHQIAPAGAVWSQACSFTNPSYVVLSGHIRSHCEISGEMCPVKLDLATSFKVL
jgi:hypothetical protein